MSQRFQFSRCFAIVLFSLLLVISPRAFAQAAGTGTITGTIMDANKAPLANAHVSIRSTDTGSERQITASDEGIYVATLLQPGVYEMTVTATGFATVTRKALVLTVGQSL